MLLGSPIWLLALAALSIPVVIHLWNIKPGKTLKVGSIALFSESSPKSSRSFKLQDVLLLVMRCLLLTLLAFLLAAPYLQQQLNNSKVKGWILIPYGDFNQTYTKFQFKIDSLTNAGYEFHFFRDDFMKHNIAKISESKIVPDTVKDKDTLNYWALTKKLSDKVPKSLKVELFTPNNINHFTGIKPQTNLIINWHTYTPVDSVSNWIAAAWLTANGDIRIMEGVTAPSGTNYQYTNIKNGNNATPYNVAIENGLPIVSLKSDPNKKVKVDTATKHIAIYADKNTADANYLKSALEAISQLTQQKTIVKQYNQAGTIPAGQDWLFWLSDKPVSTGFAKNIFQYQDGKVADLNTLLLKNNSYTVTQSHADIPLYKIIKSTRVGEAIWSDGLGDAILSLESGKTNIYHFYSRFNPTYSDLVWSDEFPKWLMELTNDLKIKAANDKRTISAEQLQPLPIGAKNETIAPQTQQISLVNYLWIALALVFLTERWLATKNNTVLTNG